MLFFYGRSKANSNDQLERTFTYIMIYLIWTLPSPNMVAAQKYVPYHHLIVTI